MVESFRDVPQNAGNLEHAQQKEGPLLSVDDILVDFASSGIYRMNYFYMSPTICLIWFLSL